MWQQQQQEQCVYFHWLITKFLIDLRPMTAVCSVLSASISLCISPSLYVSRSLSVCYSFIVSLSMRFSIDIYISVCLCVWVSLCWFTCSSSSVCRCLHVSACLSLVCSLYLSSFACNSQSIYRKLSITSFYCLSQNLSSSVQVSRPSKSYITSFSVPTSNPAVIDVSGNLFATMTTMTKSSMAIP